MYKYIQRHSSLFTIVCIVAFGVALRMYSYLCNPSLWLDEASLALNLIERDFEGLLRPLDYGQAAPLLFLLASKTATLVFGQSELGLRLVSMASGIAALLLMPILCDSANLSRNETRFATLLFAITPTCINYGVEFKQYSGDIFATVGIAFGLSMSVRNMSNTFMLVGFGLFCAAILWFSHAAIFMVAASGVVLGATSLWRRESKAILVLALVAIGWLASFSASYLLFSSKAATIPGMIEYWDSKHHSFVPMNSHLPGWLLEKIVDLPSYLGWSFPLVVVGVMSIGLVSLLLRPATRNVCVLFCVAIGMAIIASALRKYPFADRLTLWLVVPASILFAAGLCSLRYIACSKWLAFAVILFGAISLKPINQAVARIFRPELMIREDLRTVLQSVCQRSNAQDPQFAVENATRVATYYHRIDIPAGFANRRLESVSSHDVKKVLQESVSGGQRFWLLFSHISNREKEEVTNLMEGVAIKVDDIERIGAYASEWIMK